MSNIKYVLNVWICIGSEDAYHTSYANGIGNVLVVELMIGTIFSALDAPSHVRVVLMYGCAHIVTISNHGIRIDVTDAP